MVIERASKGGFFATENSVRIHSSYDPEKEASRFLDRTADKEWDGVKTVGNIILIAPGLGYLIDSIVKSINFKRLFVFFLSEETHSFFLTELQNKISSDISKRIICWNPSLGIDSVEKILSSLGDMDLAGIKILEWAPMLRAFPEEGEMVRRRIVEYLRRLSGNIHTTGGFGKRWVLNSFRNLMALSECYALPSLKNNNSPVVIVASGKYLEKSMPLLKKYSERFIIVALPSSLSALNYFGIRPDIIFSVDPGFYASLHYRDRDSDIPLALPLTACSSSLLYEFNGFNKSNGLLRNETDKPKTLLFSQKNYFENVLGNFLEHTFTGEKETGFNSSIPVIPECGTVAGTAIRWACENTSSPLFLAGLDFCFSDIHSHISPHPYETFLIKDSSRTEPYLSTLWKRAEDQAPVREEEKSAGRIRTGRSLDIYREWTRDFLSSQGLKGKTVYRISPSPKDFGIPEFPDPGNIENLPLKSKLSFQRIDLPEPEERKFLLKKIISDWKNQLGELKVESVNSPETAESPFYFFEPAKLMQIKKKINDGEDCSSLFIEFKEITGDFLNRLEKICE